MSKPNTLKSKDIEGLADLIESGQCKNIFIMAGAGISTAAGIPDFRSPETGLYSNLAHLNLPTPEAVFEINFFRRNPLPFYTLAHEIAPGKFRPTMTHSFIKLLSDKGLLHTHFTQNIDTLERRVGIPAHKIVEAHGSFATSRCIDCKKPFSAEEMKIKIAKKSIPRCILCGGLAKPEIVFFGEALPEHFYRKMYTLSDADLLFIIGTSLTVYPFAALCDLVPPECPRVLINFDIVGDIGERERDILLLGDCDETVERLCEALNWSVNLREIWEAAKESLDQAESDQAYAENIKASQEKDTKVLERTVEDLTEKVKSALNLSAEAVNGDNVEEEIESVSNLVAEVSEKQKPLGQLQTSYEDSGTAVLAPKSEEGHLTDRSASAVKK